MWTDFNSLTVIFSDLLLRIKRPPHLNSVAALPCRNLNAQLYNFTRKLLNSITFNFNKCLPRILSACLYVYADKFTACVQNVCLPNARMIWVAHATDQWMRRWRLVECCSKRSADAVAVRQHFETLSGRRAAALLCSPDFVIHRVKIWTVRWPLFWWNKVRLVSRRKSSIYSLCTSTVCWSTVLLKHELVPWYLPYDWQ